MNILACMQKLQNDSESGNNSVFIRYWLNPALNIKCKKNTNYCFFFGTVSAGVHRTSENAFGTVWNFINSDTRNSWTYRDQKEPYTIAVGFLPKGSSERESCWISLNRLSFRIQRSFIHSRIASCPLRPLITSRVGTPFTPIWSLSTWTCMHGTFPKAMSLKVGEISPG